MIAVAEVVDEEVVFVVVDKLEVVIEETIEPDFVVVLDDVD